MSHLCDLHTHSCYSDGTRSPAQILSEAAALGLSAVALTDHNTVAGLPEFLAADRESTVLAIPGVEISTGWMGKELHILGLFLPPDEFGKTATYLQTIHLRKEESNRRLVEALCRAGYPLDYEMIRSRHGTGNINRAVIATAMLEKGYISCREDAFQGILSSRNGLYQPPEYLNVFDVLDFLVSVSAVPVLAHPLLSISEPEIRRFLPEAKRHGLAAMETLYSRFSPEQTAAARELVLEFGLKESGGSDYHGEVKPDIHLGTGRGDLAVPLEFARRLDPIFSGRE